VGARNLGGGGISASRRGPRQTWRVRGATTLSLAQDRPLRRAFAHARHSCRRLGTADLRLAAPSQGVEPGAGSRDGPIRGRA
jgi:hypothetical protein